jgi:hypothetical protein
MIFKVILFQIFSTGSASVICPDSSSGTCSTGLPSVNGGSSELQTVLQIIFGVIAALSVLFVMIGGLRFVLSTGNPENVAKARETIIYALVGLVISLIAEGIVTFVIHKI